MTTMRATAGHSRNCILCRYWMGGSAYPTKIKNCWEYDPKEKARCRKQSGERSANSPGCAYYELNESEYRTV